MALSSPFLVGVYENKVLIKTYKESGRTSEILPLVLAEICDEFEIENIYFANGPGSFMAIKVTYVFLQTMSISLNVDIFAADGFEFNHNAPIRALKKVYFVKEEGEIKMRRFDEEIEDQFELPQLLQHDRFTKNCDPLYVLPAV
ncbi:hypothetical protein [Sulfurospirillum sp. 1612]|uniref:hypothetical protein n=1 Tax=Sulfurospirillum sp. 1612 TaxID=3094835 RepID=UPI002F957C1F